MVCIAEDGQLRAVTAVFRQATGDTLVVVDGIRRLFSDVYVQPAASQYAAQQSWFAQDSTITLKGRTFSKFEGRRVIPHTLLEAFGAVKGVGVFRERAGDDDMPQLVYLAYSHGCVFQPYKRQ